MTGILRTNVELRDPKTLKPYKRNNKRHPQSQIKKLMAAIAEHGFDQPIVVDKHGVIIKGHGRLAAALEMGLKQVPVIVAADLTPEQVRAARLADNAIADDAPFDFEAIKFEVGDLSNLGVDLKLTGFDDAELDRILSDLPTTEYQAPQVFGSNENWQVVQGEEEIAEALSGMTQSHAEESQAEKPEKGGVNGERFPLAIVLDWKELQEWKAVKERIGEGSDKRVFLKLMRGSE